MSQKNEITLSKLSGIASQLGSAEMKAGWFGRYIVVQNSNCSQEVISAKEIQEILKCISQNKGKILENKNLRSLALSILTKMDSEYSKCKSIFDVFRSFHVGSHHQVHVLRASIEAMEILEAFRNLPTEKKQILKVIQQVIENLEKTSTPEQIIDLKKKMIKLAYPAISEDRLVESDTIEKLWKTLCKQLPTEKLEIDLTLLQHKVRSIVDLQKNSTQLKKNDPYSIEIEKLKKEFFSLLPSSFTSTQKEELLDALIQIEPTLSLSNPLALNSRVQIYQLENSLAKERCESITGQDIGDPIPFKLDDAMKVKLRAQFVRDARAPALNSQFLAKSNWTKEKWDQLDPAVQENIREEAYKDFIRDLSKELRKGRKGLLSEVLNFMEQNFGIFLKNEVGTYVSTLATKEEDRLSPKILKQEIQISITDDKIELTCTANYDNTFITSDIQNPKRVLKHGVTGTLKLTLNKQDEGRSLEVFIEKLKDKDLHSLKKEVPESKDYWGNDPTLSHKYPLISS